MPVEFPAAGEQRLAQARVAAPVPDVPLPGGDDLQRRLAVLVELHRVHDRLGLAAQVAGRAQQPGDPGPGRRRRQPRQLPVRRLGRRAGQPRQRAVQQPPVLADHRAGVQAQVPPPGHVRGVAERADHGDAGALGRVGETVPEDRHIDTEQRRADRPPEQARVPLVVGMGDQRHAGGQQLRPGGRDQHRAGRRAVGLERDPAVLAGYLPVLELGLGDGGAERHVPQRRPVGEVRLAEGKIAQERALRDGLRAVVDGPVGNGPVHRKAEAPPCLRVRALVPLGQLQAQLHEVAPRHRHLAARRRAPRMTRRPGMTRRPRRPRRPRTPRGAGRGEIRVVGQRRVAPHAVVVLHPALGRQPVVVPPDRVEDLLAAHPPEPRDQVGVGVGEGVAEMHRPAGGQRGSVDRVDVGAIGGPVKLVLHAPCPTGASTCLRCRRAWGGRQGSWRSV